MIAAHLQLKTGKFEVELKAARVNILHDYNHSTSDKARQGGTMATSFNASTRRCFFDLPKNSDYKNKGVLFAMIRTAAASAFLYTCMQRMQVAVQWLWSVFPIINESDHYPHLPSTSSSSSSSSSSSATSWHHHHHHDPPWPLFPPIDIFSIIIIVIVINFIVN